eukprot:scaffold21493_cov107-Isochrysis_galbana.AAC.5
MQGSHNRRKQLKARADGGEWQGVRGGEAQRADGASRQVERQSAQADHQTHDAPREAPGLPLAHVRLGHAKDALVRGEDGGESKRRPDNARAQRGDGPHGDAAPGPEAFHRSRLHRTKPEAPAHAEARAVDYHVRHARRARASVWAAVHRWAVEAASTLAGPGSRRAASGRGRRHGRPEIDHRAGGLSESIRGSGGRAADRPLSGLSG